MRIARRFHRAAPISQNVAASNRRPLFRRAEVLDWTLIVKKLPALGVTTESDTSIKPTPLVLSFPGCGIFHAFTF